LNVQGVLRVQFALLSKKLDFQTLKKKLLLTNTRELILICSTEQNSDISKPRGHEEGKCPVTVEK
jgi:hypothetical protein